MPKYNQMRTVFTNSFLILQLLSICKILPILNVTLLYYLRAISFYNLNCKTMANLSCHYTNIIFFQYNIHYTTIKNRENSIGP